MGAQVRGVQQPGEPPLDRPEVQVGRRRQATAQDERLRVQHVGEVGQAEGDPLAEQIDHGQRVGVALAGGVLDVLAAHVLGVTAGQFDDAVQPLAHRGLAGQAGQPGARGVALPAPAAPARARWPVGVDHHVTDLAGEAVGPAHQAVVGDDPPADPRTKGDHDHVCPPDGRAHLPLGGDGTGGVVVHLHGSPEAGGQHRAHGEVGHVTQVRGGLDHPVAGHQAGHADAHRSHATDIGRQ